MSEGVREMGRRSAKTLFQIITFCLLLRNGVPSSCHGGRTDGFTSRYSLLRQGQRCMAMGQFRRSSSPLLCEKNGKTEQARSPKLGALQKIASCTPLSTLLARDLEKPKLLNPLRTPNKHFESGTAPTCDRKICWRKRYFWQACSADASDH